MTSSPVGAGRSVELTGRRARTMHARWRGVGAVAVGAGVATGAAGLSATAAQAAPTTTVGYGWGNNDYGQLGNGTTSMAQTTPAPMTGLTRVTQVAGGFRHSLVLRSDGTVWASGDNSNGRLGNGTTSPSRVPVRVSGLTNIKQVSTRGAFSLALRSDGTVWAWGKNGAGQRGDGTTVGSLRSGWGA